MVTMSVDVNREIQPYTLEETERENNLIMNMGPHHPATHGVLRLVLTLDGEVVKRVQPVVGYLHRSFEKMAELNRYPQFIVECNRADYVAASHYEAAYVRAVEELAGIEPTPRGQYMRVIVNELDRIQSHLLWLGTYGLDIGALNAFFYAFREREFILELFQELTGARMHYNFLRFGGVKADFPQGFETKIREACDIAEEKVDEYEDYLSGSDTFLMRTKDVGVLTRAMALDWGITGPNLRATGIDHDLRRDEPYFAYGDLDVDVPTRTEGDAYARYEVRLDEIRASVKMIRQALDRLPDGPVVPRGLEKGYQLLVTTEGEHYTHIEGARGPIGVYLVGDGTTFPYRVKLRSPCFVNLAILPELFKDRIIPDLVSINGSFDVIMPCVDR